MKFYIDVKYIGNGCYTHLGKNYIANIDAHPLFIQVNFPRHIRIRIKPESDKSNQRPHIIDIDNIWYLYCDNDDIKAINIKHSISEFLHLGLKFHLEDLSFIPESIRYNEILNNRFIKCKIK